MILSSRDPARADIVRSLRRYAGGDRLGIAAARAAEVRIRAEAALVAAVWADPAELVSVAEAEGVTAASYVELDLRLLWCVADVGRHLSVADIARAAERTLRHQRIWDGGAAVRTGPIWSQAGIADLAGREPPSAAVTRHYARRLVDVACLQRDAHEYLARAVQLLEGIG